MRVTKLQKIEIKNLKRNRYELQMKSYQLR